MRKAIIVAALVGVVVGACTDGPSSAKHFRVLSPWYKLDAFNRGDYKTAFNGFLNEARKGNASDQSMVGAMYLKGLGVTQDYEKSAKWYRLAADQGYATAQLQLGDLYGKGRGVTQDYKEAAKWLRKAAEQGYSQAQNNLGVMYLNGWGVTEDKREALMWFYISVFNGNEKVIEVIDKIENDWPLTPDQIARVQILAKKWIEKHQK